MSKKRINIDVFRDILSKFRFGKKGQITIFIILGILMLLGLILIISLKKEIVTFKPEEIVPTEKGKVENYVTLCLDKISSEALFKMGLQGGYIEVPDEISNNANVRLRISPMNVVPYWAYGERTIIPELTDLKLRLDRHIEANLRSCLLGLEPFQETYNIIEKSPIKADTQLLDGKTVFNVHWDIELRNKAGEVVTEIIDHLVENPIKLKKTYETARKVVEKEMSTLKLEDLTQDLLSLEHPEVPLAGMEVSCQEKEWEIIKVKEKLKDLLRVNLHELKVKGTEFVEFPEELPYYKNHYIWNMGETFSEPEISVFFEFQNNYPFLFEVAPRNGAYMKSGQIGGSKYLSFFCLQSWKFIYSVSYPVLVQVRDETTGYNFQVGLTVHLKNNIPNRKDIISPIISPFIETITDDKFCQSARIPMTVFTSELVENEETGVYDRNPLEKVNITFACLRYRCKMGETEYDFAQKGNIAGNRFLFPQCVGGIIRGEKSGYKSEWKRVVTENNKEIELNLLPLFKIPANKIKIVKHELIGPNQFGPAEKLSEEEIALIKITFYKNVTSSGTTPRGIVRSGFGEELYSPGQAFQESRVTLTKKLAPEMLAQTNLEFLGKADFNYDLEINLFSGEGEEAKFAGGYKSRWFVPWEKLSRANEIVFHVMSKKKINPEDQIELMLGLGENSLALPVPEVR